ncbi:FMN-binding glutamate synthase family protein [Candidatus Peregrinibacteria bacterium]|nr:MAG: FMN-binding glutamate synthase family protein [Candidatus Peregrinibacteria bacterium]
MYTFLLLVLGLVAIMIILVIAITIYDRFFQTKNVLLGNFPFLGRFRYLFHELRPFFRQYFGDDNAFAPRIIIDWILNVSNGKSGYFAFDKFDTTHSLHNGKFQMVHSSNPLNMEEVDPVYPLVGETKKHPFQMHSFFYRSAMSLGSLGFEATYAMSKACANIKAPFNTGEGSLSIQHIPNVQFSYDRKFFKYKKVPTWKKLIYKILPGKRLQNRWKEMMGNALLGQHRDLYLLDEKNWLFYSINWNAPLSDFPKPHELTDEFGQIILQIGSALYGLRGKTEDGSVVIDWDRFQKISSFVRAIEIKLAQGAKQTGGILKKNKNTPAIAEIRGIHPGKDLISPNRFPYYNKDGEKEFFDFMDMLSEKSGGKPVGCKIVISDESNIEPLAQELAKRKPGSGPDFFTIDGGDGGSGAAPIALSILFGKRIFEALDIVTQVLKKHNVRDRVKIFASSKLYAPHMSAHAMALGADAIGNARSIMISAGCIRAGVCSGEFENCPVGLATMDLGKRRAYAQAIDKKVEQIGNYITAHNHGLIQVAAVCGVKSPSELGEKHIVRKYIPSKK